MADRPSDVGRRPEHFARARCEDVPHAPRERDRVSAVVAHDAFGNARRARRVVDVQRIGGRHGDAFGGLRARDRLVPVHVAAVHHRGAQLRTLQDEAVPRLMRGHLDRAVEQRLVLDDARGLDAAGRRQDHRRLRIVDSRREFLRREAAEDDGVDGPEPGAREHAEHGLRHLRHVDDDAVAFPDAVRAQRAGQLRDRIAKLEIREGANGARDRTVVHERALLASPALNVAVDGVVAGIEHTAREPADKRRARIIEHPVPPLDPADVLGGLRPEGFGLPQRALVDIRVGVGGGRRRRHGGAHHTSLFFPLTLVAAERIVGPIEKVPGSGFGVLFRVQGS